MDKELYEHNNQLRKQLDAAYNRFNNAVNDCDIEASIFEISAIECKLNNTYKKINT